MLNPRYKSLHIVSSFVGREQHVVLVGEYDRKSLYPMLVKCHEHLHPNIQLIPPANQMFPLDMLFYSFTSVCNLLKYIQIVIPIKNILISIIFF